MSAYRINTDIGIRVGVTSFTAKAGRWITVQQWDKDNRKALVDFGGGLIDWFSNIWLERNTSYEAEGKA